MSKGRIILLLVAGTIVAISGIFQIVSDAGMVWLGVILLLSAIPPLVVGVKELQSRD